MIAPTPAKPAAEEKYTASRFSFDRSIELSRCDRRYRQKSFTQARRRRLDRQWIYRNLDIIWRPDLWQQSAHEAVGHAFHKRPFVYIARFPDACHAPPDRKSWPNRRNTPKERRHIRAKGMRGPCAHCCLCYMNRSRNRVGSHNEPRLPAGHSRAGIGIQVRACVSGICRCSKRRTT